MLVYKVTKERKVKLIKMLEEKDKKLEEEKKRRSVKETKRTEEKDKKLEEEEKGD